MANAALDTNAALDVDVERQLRIDLAGAHRLVAQFGWDDPVFTHERIERRIPFTPASLRALYATFSPLRALTMEDRDVRLNAVEARAASQAKDDHLHRVFASPFYLAQKPL